MNSVNIIGRITKTPELRRSSGGKYFTSFTLAINSDKTRADYIPVVAWDRNAENVVKFLEKGSMTGISGKLVSQQKKLSPTDQYETTLVSVVAYTITFFGERKPQKKEPEAEKVFNKSLVNEGFPDDNIVPVPNDPN